MSANVRRSARAGGRSHCRWAGALLKAVEGAEDNKQLGEDDLKGLNLNANDRWSEWPLPGAHLTSLVAGICQSDGLHYRGYLL